MPEHDDDGARGVALFHPVYLDVPMMISFLAALRDGVAFEDTLTRRDSQSASRDREGTARIGLPSLGALFGFNAAGRMASSSGEEITEEVMAVRRHTEASLFNALYAALGEKGLIRGIAQPADLEDLKPGDIVEIFGEFVGNPLEPVVAFFKQALPYFDIAGELGDDPELDVEALAAAIQEGQAEVEDLSRQASNAGRSGNPATKAKALELRQQVDVRRAEVKEARRALDAMVANARERHKQLMGVRLIQQVGEDLATTPVQDTVVSAESGLKAVLTMSAEFFTDSTRALLRAGAFRVVGKVTRVLTNDDEVNLLRRTVLGAAGADVTRDLLKGAVQNGELRLETFDPVIQAPAVQVLPLAVFV
jgi:hypothetical protein